MCFCFPFGLSNNQKRKSSSSAANRKRRSTALHGDGVPVVAEVQEKHKSREETRKRRSRETVIPRRDGEERRYREEYRPRPRQQNQYQSREQYRPALNVEIPTMWHRQPEYRQPESTNTSEEMLLNPRPHRSPHHRQRHPKRTSQTKLAGRGAKRSPKPSKSKKDLRGGGSGGWSFFAPSPPKTPKTTWKRDHRYEPLESSPRAHRSPRQHRSSHQESPRPQQRHNRPRQTERQPPAPARQTRSRTPNTAARRDPDRRFAVLARTNEALEALRVEAFQPSPPPRQRLRRYQGVNIAGYTIPASSVPFEWDCVSSSQTSAGYGEPSTRHRRSRR